MKSPNPEIAHPSAVHDWFRRQALCRGEEVAIAGAHHSVLYGELEARSNRIAHLLRAAGASREACAGIITARSDTFVAAALGVLKSGAAILPIEPAWPAERQAFVLADCAARLVLTDGSAVPAATGSAACVIDLSREDLGIWPETPPGVIVEPDQLAYVIYTSGSTGQPKGVMVEHGALAAHLASITSAYALSPADRCLWFHSVAADPTIEQVFGALVCGARVVIAPHPYCSGSVFTQWVRGSGVTVADLPPACWLQVLRDWVAAPELLACAPLRLVIVGGEALPPAAVGLWRELGLTSLRLLNAYGPTECTVTATLYEVPSEAVAAEAQGRIPIGRPHGPVQSLILDPELRVVAAGVPGELCLAGGTLARGYRGRPDATAERFVPHPEATGGRLYRTGDRARLLPNGDLEFLGRLDDQIKIRGFRVEPGEVESALQRHPGVNSSAVVAVDKGGGDRHLAAFYVPAAAGLIPSAAELRAFLADLLPAHAIPSTYRVLETLPLKPGGKIDRARLAAEAQVPDQTPPAAAGGTAPDATESIILRIWTTILGTPVPLDASVFDLGATSLSVTRAHQEMQRELGRPFPIVTLFEHRTPRALAAALAAKSANPALPPARSILGRSALERARRQREAMARRLGTPARP